MDTIQNEVQAMIDELTESGVEDGIQVAAYYKGTLVVNACSGIADPRTERRVDEDTLFVAMSCSKGVVATVVHRLAEAGKLGYDDPVADCWPEFAANGKERITIRHVLAHEAGIPQMPERSDIDVLCDWEAMTGKIAELEPLWAPGAKSGYHGYTYGFILGEVARRADGRPFGQIVEEDICRPLGISVEMYFGAPAEAEPRIAFIRGEPLPWAGLPDDALIKQMLPVALSPNVHPAWNGPKVHGALLPASCGIMTANALARMYAALMEDGVDGVRLVGKEQMREATALATDKPDEVLMGLPIPKALGYWLGDAARPISLGGSSRTFGHTGNGGMVGFADPEHHLAFALLKNRLTYGRGPQETDVLVAERIRRRLKEWSEID